MSIGHFEGALRERTFFSVFHELFVRRATGLLSARRGERNKDVFLENGQPVFVASNVPGERFGDFLVNRGQLARDALEKALDATNESGESLGRALITLGFLSEGDIIEALRDQQMTRLIDVCAWDSGTFAFHDNQRFVGEKFELELNSVELLMRAAREMPESVIADRLRPHMLRLVGFGPAPHPFILSSTELDVVRQLDGLTTPQLIVDRYSNAPNLRRTALNVLYLTWEAGLLQMRDAG